MTIQPDSRAIQRKLIARLQNIRVIPRAINLLLAPPPLGLINGINPILDLHNNASILGNCSRSIRHIVQTLRALERHTPVLPTAAIDLERVLVREHVDLDTGPVTAKSSHGTLLAPVVRPLLVAVGEVAGIVAGAVEAAVPEQIWVREVGADLLGRGPEIVERVLLVGEDVAGGDQDVVCAYALAGVRHPEGVIEGEGGLVVGEAVEVPVCLCSSALVLTFISFLTF
jgi:hypothetical protein